MTSSLRLGEATALLYGAKSSSFFKKSGAKADHDWQCFSLVFKERPLDFAATNLEQLLDWYLALASLLPRSEEPLLDERGLRARIDAQIAGLTRTRGLLDQCIGCGCLSLKKCGLYNAQDKAAQRGAGPRYVLGDRAGEIAEVT